MLTFSDCRYRIQVVCVLCICVMCFCKLKGSYDMGNSDFDETSSDIWEDMFVNESADEIEDELFDRFCK